MVVYKITNKVNNKIYIGCAINYEKRIKSHKSCKYKGALLLYRAFLKYTIDNFTFEIIKEFNSKEEMWEGEIESIKYFNSINPFGYNLHYGGKGGKIKLTDQQLIARQNHARNLSKNNINNKYNLGRVASEETRKKISLASEGRVMSEEAKLKMSLSKKGNNYAKGIIRTDEYKKKLSDIKKGTTFSLETRKKMSDAAKIRVLNSERDKDGKFK